MYSFRLTNEFEKDFKLCKKRGLDVSRINEIISKITHDGVAPQETRPHKLSGAFSGLWECHVNSNWLLVWRQDDENRIIEFVATGSHSDIF